MFGLKLRKPDQGPQDPQVTLAAERAKRASRAEAYETARKVRLGEVATAAGVVSPDAARHATDLARADTEELPMLPAGEQAVMAPDETQETVDS